ncbi:hypothetical protein T440DRAFT_467370 [Plenodomus tracheiphilus IPT5]|uniref:Uncharacterized protein n=1 Tax=Plenodomus tracheiphilus IPT5 TaxID=1408161 RepID=A0A6A7B9G6_9PLEO|nr:hypothetical protein T440DRAFT_467370 [Plenodomus tracheiphilus IPT5]
MKVSTTVLSIGLLTALTLAAPSSLDARQSGGSYVSVGYKYSGPGCTDSSLIFVDPIFGNGNVCQALDRFGDNPPIVSYSTFRVAAGCSVTLYTGVDCTGTAYLSPAGGCVTGNAPFVSAFVTCT